MTRKQPKFEAIVGGDIIDITDTMLPLYLVIDTIERMIPATKMRLIMELLGRTHEYHAFLQHEADNVEKT